MNLKRYLSLLTCVLLLINALQAQVQDCPTAEILCSKDSIIVQQVTGAGNPDDVINNSCFQDTEHQSHWFTFYCTKSGTFEMSVHAINYQADFDFSLWEGGCPGAPGSVSKACNWFGGVVIPPYLATGIANDPQLSFNEPNNLEFIPTITLVAGQVYYLLVDNITNNGLGFIMYMGGTSEIGKPVLNYSAGIFCNASTVDLSGIQVIGIDSVAGSVQYYSKFLDANNGTNELIPPIVNKSGNYYVKKITPHGCSTVQTLGVTIENPDITIDDVYTCGATPFDLSTLKKKEGTGLDLSTFKFTYYNSQADLLNGINPITGNTISKSGTYWVKAESQKGCIDITPFNVLLEKPTASINGAVAICPGESITLPIVYNGRWPVDITILASGVGSIKDNLIKGEPLIVHPQHTTTYTITGMKDTLGCSADLSGSYIVTVNEIPEIKAVNIDCSTNPGNPILIVTCSGGNEAGYVMTGVSGSFSGNIFTSVPLTSGNSYSLILKDNFNCGADTLDGVADCNCDPLFKAALLVTQPKCFEVNDGTIIASISGGNLPYSFKWSNGEVTKDLDNLNAGNFDVTVTDGINCKTTASAVVNKPAKLKMNYTTQDLSCFDKDDGEILVEDITGGTSPYTYTIESVKYTSFPETVKDLPPGNYNVVIEDVNGCLLTENFKIDNALPFDIYLGQDKNILEGATVDIQLSGNVNEMASVIWNSDLNLPCNSCNEVKFLPAASGYISIEAQNNAGCTSVDTMNITLIPVLKDTDDIYIPNVFSPNGDGINDRFMPLYGEILIQEGNLKVYNRWGGLVYNEEFIDDPKGWDGRFHNKYVNTDVFVYVLQLKIANRVKVYKGDVTVER